MKNLIEKFGQGKVLTILGITITFVALVLGTGMMNKNETEHDDTSPELVADTVTHEVNTELSMDLSTYMNNVDLDKSYSMDFTEVDTPKVGLYKATISYDNLYINNNYYRRVS